jgi:type IV secretion system protein VirB4
MVVCQPHLTKKARLEVDSITHWMAVNSAGENLLRREYFLRYGIAEGLRRLAEEHPFERRRQARALTLIPHGAAA